MSGIERDPERPAGPVERAGALSELAADALGLGALSAEVRRLKLDARLDPAAFHEATQALELANRRHLQKLEAKLGRETRERAALVREALDRLGGEFPAPVREAVLARLDGAPQAVPSRGPSAVERTALAEEGERGVGGAPGSRLGAPVSPPAAGSASRPGEPRSQPLAVTLIAAPPRGVAASPTSRAVPGAGGPELDEARRERRNLLAGFAIGAVATVGGSIPLAGIVWRSENDLLKYAAFAGVALVFFGAGRVLDRRLGLTLAGRTLGTIFLLLVPILLAIADELKLGGPAFAISLALGLPVIAAARTLLATPAVGASTRAAEPIPSSAGRRRSAGLFFGAAFFAASAASFVFPVAARTASGALLALAVAGIGAAGALAEVEGRLGTLPPAGIALAVGGTAYASGVVVIRAVARLDLDAAAIATPLLLIAAPALVVGPRLLTVAPRPDDTRPAAFRVPGDGRRVLGTACGAIGFTLAIAAYLIALVRPATALETAAIGTLALAAAAVLSRSPRVAVLATLSLGVAYVAATALALDPAHAAWPSRWPGRALLPLAGTLALAGLLLRVRVRLRPISGPPLAAAAALAIATTALEARTDFLAGSLFADVAILGGVALLLERTRCDLPPGSGEGTSRAERGDVSEGDRVGAAHVLAALAIAALGAVPFAHVPALEGLELGTLGALVTLYGVALAVAGRLWSRARGSLAFFAPVVSLMGTAEALLGAALAHPAFGPRAPGSVLLAAGVLAAPSAGAILRAAAGRLDPAPPPTTRGFRIARAAGAVALAAIATAEVTFLARFSTPRPPLLDTLAEGALSVPLLGLALALAILAALVTRLEGSVGATDQGTDDGEQGARSIPGSQLSVSRSSSGESRDGPAREREPLAEYEYDPGAIRTRTRTRTDSSVHESAQHGTISRLAPQSPLRPLAAVLVLSALLMAMCLSLVAAFAPAAIAARHLCLAAAVAFTAVLARPSPALVALGQTLATAGAMFALSFFRRVEGLEAVDPLALGVIALVWIGISTVLSRAAPSRLFGLAERATDFAAFSLACASAVVLWLAWPALAAIAAAAPDFPPAYLGASESLAALLCAALAFAVISARVPSAEAGVTAAAMVFAAWLVLALAPPLERSAAPLAAASTAALHMAVRASARRGAPAALAALPVLGAIAYALCDLRDGWRVGTLLVSGPVLYAAGAARGRRAVAALGVLLVSIGCGALTFFVGARVHASFAGTTTALAGVALSLAVFFFEVGHRPRGAGKKASADPVLAGAAALCAVAVPATLSLLFVTGAPAPLELAETAAGLTILLGLSLALFRAAVRAGSEPLAYAGQLAFAAAALFLKVARPDLFTSELFQRFWPIILVLLAYVAFGLGAVLERRGLAVLAHPIERVAVVIAVAPAGSVFVTGSGEASLALFLSAAFYGALAATRKRPAFAAAALLFANGGLHPLLLLGGFRYLYQPGVFFGPLGLSLVLAAHLARERIGDEAREALRTAGAFLVFASLTFSVYADVAHRTAESLALALLCVMGAIAGMRLRVPAYVYLGASFLLLDVASHIYWAGREHPFIWWVSLVLLGVAVIGYFALLERRRARANSRAHHLTRDVP